MPGPMRRRAAVLVVVALVVLGAVATVVWVRSRPLVGAAVAAASERFARCWENTPGQAELVGPDDVEDGDRTAEERFWAQPQALHCAVTRFEEPVRRRALQVAFPAPDDGGDAAAQREVVRDYATWSVEEQDTESAQVLLRAGAVLRALWVADADDDLPAAGYAETAVLADLAAQGELPGYPVWLAEQDRADDASALADYVDDDLVQDRPENEAPYRAFADRSDALLEVVR